MTLLRFSNVLSSNHTYSDVHEGILVFFAEEDLIHLCVLGRVDHVCRLRCVAGNVMTVSLSGVVILSLSWQKSRAIAIMSLYHIRYECNSKSSISERVTLTQQGEGRRALCASSYDGPGKGNLDE